MTFWIWNFTLRTMNLSWKFYPQMVYCVRLKSKEKKEVFWELNPSPTRFAIVKMPVFFAL